MKLTVLKLLVAVLPMLCSFGQVFSQRGEKGQKLHQFGLLDGTFLQLRFESATWEESRWKEFFHTLEELQMSQLILQWTVYDGRAFYRSAELETVGNPPLGTILRLAKDSGIDVWLGLAHDSDYWENIQRNPSLVEVYLQKRRVESHAIAQELAEILEGHSSFKGWYLNEEIDDRNWLPPAARQILVLHLQQLVAELQDLSPGKAVAISGFSSGYSSPQVLGELWDGILASVPIDLLLFQDGIGVKQLDLYTLPLYLDSLRKAVERHKTEMRVVVELFDQTSSWDEPFAAEPADPDRILRQLELAAEFSRRPPIAFSILEYMAPFAEKRARDLYRRYLAESKGR